VSLRREAISRWGVVLLSFAAADFLIYYGTMMGFACPGCGLRDPGVWRYTVMPWMGGAALLTLSGCLYHHAAQPARDLFSSIVITFSLGIGILFGLFVAFAIIAGMMH
jgi:hypothetical protein